MGRATSKTKPKQIVMKPYSIKKHIKEWTAATGNIYQEGLFDLMVDIDRRELLGKEIEFEGSIYIIVGSPATEVLQVRLKENK